MKKEGKEERMRIKKKCEDEKEILRKPVKRQGKIISGTWRDMYF